MILEAVDRIEDELDSQIALPLRIRLFLEENLFGWDHLSSDIIGSLFYPLFVSIAQYYIFTFLWMEDSLFEEVTNIVLNHFYDFVYIKNATRMHFPEFCRDFKTSWNHFIREHQIVFGFLRLSYSIVAGTSSISLSIFLPYRIPLCEILTHFRLFHFSSN